jgi:hypothetical protein
MGIQYIYMPVVFIQTAIPSEEYQRFKRRMQELGLTKYALAQEAIIVFVNEPTKSQKKALYQKLKEAIENDLKNTI